jgi:hypothetical protein
VNSFSDDAGPYAGLGLELSYQGFGIGLDLRMLLIERPEPPNPLIVANPIVTYRFAF